MDSRRRFFFLLAILIALGCRLSSEMTPAAPEARDGTAILTPERDNVEHGTDESALVQVLSSVPVSAGEFIRITEGGEALLDFGEALRLRLFNDTEMQTINTEPAPGASGAAYVFSLQQGGLTGQLTKAGESAVIETPGGATITILGTQFFVVYDPATGETTVGNFDGSVQVDDGSASFPLGASRQVTIPGGVPEPLPVSYVQFEQQARSLGPVAAVAALQPEPPSPTPTFTPSPTPSPPDLVVAGMEVIGEPRFESQPSGIALGQVIRVPVRLTVTNRGTRPAPVFQVGIQARLEQRDMPLCFAVAGNAEDCFPVTDGPLPGGESRTFEGLVSLPGALAGSTVQLAGIADFCVRDRNVRDFCQVQESDETNNQFFAPALELPSPPAPDLIISSITSTDEIFRQRNGEFAVPVAVTVSNVGGMPAEIFKVSTEAITPNGQFLFPFTVGGQQDVWYPFTSAPLAPGASVTFQGIVTIPDRYAGLIVQLLALADSCAAEEFAEPTCRVVEGDEENNWSTELSVRLPVIVD
ncbi:MAG: hypothetical protein GX579_17455 [Chloroflexi bacterium]|nr:hypothetical protein [Chloroflexota bacterium]